MNTALAIAVLNGLWQGMALVALTALALRVWTRRNAATTCAVWTAVYFIVALLPLADVALVQRVDGPAPPAPRSAPLRVEMAAPANEAAAMVSGAAAAADVADAQRGMTFDVAAPRASDVLRTVGARASAAAGVAALPLFALWLAVAAVLLARLVAGYRAVLRIKRVAHPLADARVRAHIAAAQPHRPPAVATSDFVSVPCAVGFFHPMILLPAALADTLDADDLARVVLHELAHLQRRDDWLNALQRIAGALFFFQPALAYAGRRIDLAREMACDDRVLESTGEPIRYAECLTKIVARRVRPHLAAVPGFVFGRAQVVQRVRTIVERRGTISSRIARSAAAAAVAAAFAAFAIARVQVPVVAQLVAPDAPVAARHAAPLVAPPVTRHAATIAPHAAAAVAPHAPAAVAPHAPAVVAPRARAAHADAPVRHPAVPAKAVVPSKTAVAQRVLTTSLPPVARLPVHVAPLALRAAAVAPLATASSMADMQHAAADVRRVAVEVRVADETPGPAASANSPSTGITVFAPRVTLQRVDMLDALEAGGYGHPSVDDLIALHNAGVSGTYIKTMGALGSSKPSLRDLIALRNAGVTSEFVAAAQRLFGPKITAGDVIALRDQGASTLYLTNLAGIAYPGLGVRDVLALAAQGVSSAYVRDIASAGYRTFSAGELIALHNRGVTGTYLRRLREHGYANVPLEKILELKASGFEP